MNVGNDLKIAVIDSGIIWLISSYEKKDFRC